MALQFANRVRVTVTSTGTGAMSLGPAISGMADFTGVSSGSQVGYCVEDVTGAWEVGQGTYTAGSPGTLSRDTIEASSNGGTVVSLNAGAQVYLTPTAAWLSTFAAILPSGSAPLMNGAAAAGTAATYSRADHVHPTDTSRAPLVSPALTGAPTAPTAALNDNSTLIATTAYVLGQAAVGTPLQDGTASIGTTTRFARGDHVHPTDTSRAPLASPAMTGVPTAPTPAADTNTTQLATAAFVLGQASAVTPLPDGAAAVGTSLRYARADHVHSFPPSIGRNLLNNSLFRVQQRGAGPWTTPTYTADRWVVAAVTDTFSASVVALADLDRTAIADEDADYGYRVTWTGTAGSTAYTLFSQRVENARRLSGRTITVVFFAQATAAGVKVGCSLDQVFGTGGSPSASVLGAGSFVTLSTAWTRYKVSLTVPSTSGKVFGTNQDHFTSINFWLSSGSGAATRAGIGVQSGTATFWGIESWVGTDDMPLEKLDPATDLANCQRFYQVGLAWFSAAINGVANMGYFLPLPVTMRGVPTVTFSNQAYGNCASLSASNLLVCGFIAYAVTIASANAFFSGNYTAAADL